MDRRNTICIKGRGKAVSDSENTTEHSGDNETRFAAKVSFIFQKRGEGGQLHSRLHLRNTGGENGGRGRKGRKNSSLQVEKKAFHSGLQGSLFQRNKIEIDDEIPEQIVPELVMVAAIVKRAYEDAIAHAEHLDVKQHHKREAIRWFISESQQPWSFLWCAQLLSEDEQHFKKTVISKIQEESGADFFKYSAQLDLIA